MEATLAAGVLRLSEAKSPADACQAFSECVGHTLTTAKNHITVFVWDEDKDLLHRHGHECRCFSGDDDDVIASGQASEKECQSLPTSGVLRQVVVEATKEVTIGVGDVDLQDPVRTVLPFAEADNDAELRCCAVVGRKDQSQIVAVYAVLVGSRLSETTAQSLVFLQDMLAVAVERLGVDRSEHEAKRQHELISRLMLCRNNSADIAMEVCSTAQEMTGAAGTAFLRVNDTDDQLVCQLINSVVPKPDLIMPVTNGPFSHAVLSGSVHILKHLTVFHDQLVTVAGFFPSSVLCAPVVHTEAQESGEKGVVAVLAVFHKDGRTFTSHDKRDLEWVVNSSRVIFLQSVLREAEGLGQMLNQALLQVAETLFLHIGDLSALLKQIMVLAKELTSAERCSVFLLEKNNITGEEELVSHIFDNDVSMNTVRLSLRKGIAGLVARTGELKNIPDAYSCEHFNQEVDQKSGFHTRNILCFPIQEQGGIIGVAQLCNKIGGAAHFTHVDEELAKAFAIYCGISISHSMLYRRAVDAQNRSHLATELLIYHMQVPEEDVSMHTNMPILKPSRISKVLQLNSFRFMDGGIDYDKTIRVLMTMFDDMGLINRFQIPKDNLCRFLLMVQKGYREPPYHNWRHALSVAQFCYCLWKRCEGMKPLTELEVFGFFVASLCHDIDHRGTNNTFQVNAHSVLAALYSSGGSVMERHHLAQTLGILNSESCNIFCNLSREEYQKVLDVVKNVILATDVAAHLRKLDDFKTMVKDGINSANAQHHALLLSLLMTSCDLNACTKPWMDAQYYAELIYKEFFTQGDLERAMKMQPMEMMDRHRACIPEQQIGFINFIARPVYELLAQVFPQTRLVFARLQRNYDNWVIVKQRYWEASNASSDDADTLASSVGEGLNDLDELSDTEEIDEGAESPLSDRYATEVQSPVSWYVETDEDPTPESQVKHQCSPSSSPGFAQLAGRANLLSAFSSNQEREVARAMGSLIAKQDQDSLRASTGCIDFKRKTSVCEVARSRRASTTMGVDCIMKVARLQAPRSTPLTLHSTEFFKLTSLDLPDQMKAPPLQIERVTDPVQDTLLSHVELLSARSQSHGSLGEDPGRPSKHMKRRQGAHLRPALKTPYEAAALAKQTDDKATQKKTERRHSTELPFSSCSDHLKVHLAKLYPKTSDPTGKRYPREQRKTSMVTAQRKFSDPFNCYPLQARIVTAQRFCGRSNRHSSSVPNLSSVSFSFEPRHTSDPCVWQNIFSQKRLPPADSRSPQPILTPS